MNNTLKIYFLLAALVSSLLFSFNPLSADDELKQRLQNVAASFESLRQEMKIPGMALAIVKDDKVIFSEGFGYRDVDGKIPVTPDTNFAIGSTSKAFTAALIGMLNDEGKMDLDSKITDYIDWYKPDLNEETGNLTIRDMLSHRSGISRNDILWASGKVDREAILRESLDAEPLDGFRQRFNYNNVLFLAAGMASAKTAGLSDWDALLAERLLGPLQMESTTSINSEATNMANGYRWDKHEESYVLLEMKNLDNISPAGGINSNIIDMAKWLKFNLNKGQVDGKRLLSEAQFEQIWSPAIGISQGFDYGLGWFIRDWKGKKVLEHGGNIQGFAAQVGLMPEEKLGFVLLTNTSTTPLQQGSLEIVWNGLLGEEETETTAEKPDDFAQNTGRYIANFGPFKNAIFTVKVNDDGDLAVDVPGQTLYALKRPDESGKWYFKMTDTIAVSFSDHQDGQAMLLTMHQNGMDFESPREGYVVPAEVDIAVFEPLLGDYNHPNLPRPIRALIQNNRLAIDVPGEMIYELRLPDDDQHRQFRINEALSARFSTDESGNGETVSIYRGKQKALTAERVEDATEETLPSVAEILKLMRTEQKIAAFNEAGPTSASAKVSMLQAGVTGTAIMHYEGTDRFAQHFDFGDYGKISTVLNGNFAATKGLEPYNELQGELLLQMQHEHPLAGIDWLSYYDSLKVKEKRKVGGERMVYLVEIKKEGLPPATIAVDIETGDVIKRRGGLIVRDIGTIPIEITYSDFREQGGVRVPYKVNLFNRMSGNMLLEFESFKSNQTFSADVFTLSEEPYK